MTKIVFATFAVLICGAGYVTYYGIGAESMDVVSSVRAGSIGNARSFGVK